MFGKTALKISSVEGEIFASSSPNERAAAPSTNANMPTPIPQARASGRRSPNDRLVGPRRPSVASGNPGHGMRLVDPRSRREKASTPIANRTIVTSATSASDSQSGWPMSGWWWTVQPNQVRFARPANAGTVAWYPLRK